MSPLSKYLQGPVRQGHVLLAWILVMSAAFGYIAVTNHNLAVQNQQRITDIQESRVTSCRQTYEGIREVFKPFFPPAPRTKKQQDDLDKFNKTVNRLKKRCVKQTTQGVDTGGTP